MRLDNWYDLRLARWCFHIQYDFLFGPHERHYNRDWYCNIANGLEYYEGVECGGGRNFKEERVYR